MTIKMICQSIEEAGLKEESWWIGLQIELEWAKRHEGDGEEEEKEKTFRKFDLGILQVQIRELLVKVVRKGKKHEKENDKLEKKGLVEKIFDIKDFKQKKVRRMCCSVREDRMNQ